ncbi:hypothetical protein DRQ25_08735 [Candidatus Fermentibacteria bacterium]|nr:MAG: hypothetical protein DRQ25_08735 [Candidatus Fermentibacteria bacterium]
MRRTIVVSGFVAVSVLLMACSITDPLTLLRCQFRIENTEDFLLTGIQLDSLENLSVVQIAEVAAIWASGSCPVDFTLNIGIHNPNNGSTGPDIIPVTLSSLVWDLYLDGDSETVFDTTWVASGTMSTPLEIPGANETVLLPLDISFDAFALMSEVGVLNFIDLALAIGGIDSGLRTTDHIGRMLVTAVPTISTPIGPMTYTGSLNISLDWID